MITEEIRSELYRLRDEEYRDFQSKLIPTVDKDDFIGVRTPELRRLAKAIVKSGGGDEFLRSLPHRYFDENQLHAFVVSEIKDIDKCIAEVNVFLPYMDNWATCDQMSPGVFKKHHSELLVQIQQWIKSEHTYTVRFAIGMLMEHFLGDDLEPEYPQMVSEIRSDEYYINMMIAWYFATALAKQYDVILPFIEDKKLDKWTHNKAIQKATESRRITPEKKDYLRSLKIK